MAISHWQRLRDITRKISDAGTKVCVIDERREIFKSEKLTHIGFNSDVYSGYPKTSALNIAKYSLLLTIVEMERFFDTHNVGLCVYKGVLNEKIYFIIDSNIGLGFL